MLFGSDEVSNGLLLLYECREDESIQQYACWAIANLAVADDDARKMLKDCGLAEVRARYYVMLAVMLLLSFQGCRMAIESFATSAEVVKQARNAIGALGPSMSNTVKPSNATVLLSQSSLSFAYQIILIGKECQQAQALALHHSGGRM